MTPLHISSKKGINDVVVILLDEGADLHAKDKVISLKETLPLPPLAASILTYNLIKINHRLTYSRHFDFSDRIRFYHPYRHTHTPTFQLMRQHSTSQITHTLKEI